MTSELTLLYVHGKQIGYARVGTYLADTLESRGYDVYDDHGQDWEKRLWSMQKLHGHRNVAKTPTNLTCMVSVPTHLEGWWSGQYKAIITMWEATHVPESFRDTFHEFDMIIVPSYQNLELLSQYHDNAHLMLLGVDPKVWHYIEPPPVGPEFRFLISGRGQRKGVDVAVSAFRKVFPYARPLRPGMAVPKLIIKSMRGLGEHFVTGIDQTTGKLTDEEELSLYSSVHCYVQPSRGEGFGLQPLQAIALGRPTILTNGHGHASFAHLGTHPIGWEYTEAGDFIYGEAGQWWEPNLDEVCEAMYDVYMNYEDSKKRAKESAAIVARDWTWDKTTDRFIELLGDQMAAPFTGSKEWLKPESRVYRIITNKDWYGEIGGRAVYFKAGQEYFDKADVKRIFYDAGLLDPSCIFDTDHGLAPIQVAQRAEYDASRSDCPTCGRPLNTGPTLSDRIYEGLQNASSPG
jgi:glycosyltransferase involved in cell wall biosynthesis